jgi:preprotein translocase subunit SecA
MPFATAQKFRLTRRINHEQRLRSFRKFEKQASSWSDSEIERRAVNIKDAFLEGNSQKQMLVGFAGLIGEVVFRTHGFRLHDVQAQGLFAGSRGAMLEMQTGEGKTIVTGAIAAIQSLTHPSVHVATTNDYLAARDLNELSETFSRLGLTAGLLPSGYNVGAAQKAYQSNITYGPGYQFGFDYLRDQVFLRTNRQSHLGRTTINSLRGIDPRRQLAQPSEHCIMIVDEADSVMIDEATTPLVISDGARNAEDPTPYNLAKQVTSDLKIDIDFTIKLPDQGIEVDDSALERCHELISDRALELERPWRIYITNALQAAHVLKKNVDYVVLDDEVHIVDKNTGRIFSDRTWQDGLHQAVESKEGVEIKSAPPSVARITRQRYFQLYDQLSGLTGTATAVTREFKTVYRVPVVPIPTHLPCVRQNLRSRFFADTQAKLDAIAIDVEKRHTTGQPILIGTRTIDESKSVCDALVARNLEPIVLNGLQDQDEAEIVAQAGSVGAITIATNMAGRGTDIKPNRRALDLGGLHVVGSSPNGSTRIDRQLVGRAARQGNPGSAQFFVSSEDEVIARHSPSLAKKIANRGSKGETKADFSNELSNVQRKIEAYQCESRQKMVLKDNWMDLVRESIDKE